MNKGVLAVIGLLFAGVVIGGGYFALKNNSSLQTNTSLSQTQNPTNQPSQAGIQTSGSMSIKDILAAGVAEKCSFEDTTNKSSGTVYVANGKIRGDFQTVSSGKAVMSHMVMMDNMFNVWMDGQSLGFKTSVTSSTDANNYSAAAQAAISADQKYNYHCEPWMVDNGLFVLPTTVEFKDLSSITTTVPTASGSSSYSYPQY